MVPHPGLVLVLAAGVVPLTAGNRSRKRRRIRFSEFGREARPGKWGAGGVISHRIQPSKHDNGGWEKNKRASIWPRQPQSEKKREVQPGHAEEERRITTIDNGATYTQMQWSGTCLHRYPSGRARFKDGFERHGLFCPGAVSQRRLALASIPLRPGEATGRTLPQRRRDVIGAMTVLRPWPSESVRLRACRAARRSGGKGEREALV